VLSEALNEFAGAVKIARDNLDEAIADVVPDEFFEADPDGEGYEAGALVLYATTDIDQAFRDFDGALARALRALRQTLAAVATETQGGAS
jgi:hypothetical protein